MSQQVNLFSPLFRRQEKKFSALAMLQAGGAIVAGIALLILLNFWQIASMRSELRRLDGQQADATKKLDDVTRQFKPRVGDRRLAEDVAKLEAIAASSGQVQALLRRDVFSDSRGYSGYFIALARHSLPELQLTGVDITGAGQTFEFTGRTTAPERVPQYLQRLSTEKSLSGAEFKVFRMERPEEQPDPSGRGSRKPVHAPYVEFTIRSDVASKAGKP